MLTPFRNWRRRNTAFPAPAPDQPLAILGDVHGRDDLLYRAPQPDPDAQIVFVGDYVDRGENSAAVLRLLRASPHIICLMGNHEEMMLRFLDAPEKHGSRWLRYGGLQTLASFGINRMSETSDAKQLAQARDALADAMGAELIAWVQALPSYWQSGNVVVTHAGADPGRPMDLQDTRALRWGHPEFEKTPRQDGLCIVHGHTIVAAPVMERGRINVDTGAYATGRLTIAHITDQDVRFDTIT